MERLVFCILAMLALAGCATHVAAERNSDAEDKRFHAQLYSQIKHGTPCLQSAPDGFRVETAGGLNWPGANGDRLMSNGNYCRIDGTPQAPGCIIRGPGGVAESAKTQWRTLFYVPTGWIGYVSGFQSGDNCMMIKSSSPLNGWIADFILTHRERIKLTASANAIPAQ
jgi:hypothetical protein